MFAREIQLRTLTSAKTWFMDGTVLMAPGIFSQLYVIRIPLGKSAVTAIYAFLPNKAQRTYKEMFQVITDACIRQVLMLIQKKVVCDLEKAVINALKNILGDDILTHG